jgi:hypothetical protein
MLLAAVIGGAAASMLFWHSGEQGRQKQILERSKEEAERAQNDRRFRRHTGVYGEASEIFDLLQDTKFVCKETPGGTDLQGAPFKWVHLHNGAIYRSYDVKNPQVLTAGTGSC